MVFRLQHVCHSIMNKTYIIVAFIILFSAEDAMPQVFFDSTYYSKVYSTRNILKTNPFSIFQGSVPLVAEYRIMYERVLSLKQSVSVSGSYLGKGPYLVLYEASTNDPIDFRVTGYRFQAEYKFYPRLIFRSRTAPEGIYFAPTYSYSTAKFSNRRSGNPFDYLSLTYTYYCVKAGYQYIEKNLAIDGFVGAGIRDNIWVDFLNNSSTVIDSKEYEMYPGRLKILFGFNVGWAF